MAAKKVLVLRTCNADGTSYGGFKWPKNGPVKCTDWNSEPVCGAGLHGLLWGEGDGSRLNWGESALWQVVEVLEKNIVQLDGKVKFPRGRVVHAGNQESATRFLLENGAAGRSVVGGTATAGYLGTATAGDGGTLCLSWWDIANNRRRLAVAYVGENGILPNTSYRLDDNHNFVVRK